MKGTGQIARHRPRLQGIGQLLAMEISDPEPQALATLTLGMHDDPRRDCGALTPAQAPTRCETQPGTGRELSRDGRAMQSGGMLPCGLLRPLPARDPGRALTWNLERREYFTHI